MCKSLSGEMGKCVSVLAEKSEFDLKCADSTNLVRHIAAFALRGSVSLPVRPVRNSRSSSHKMSDNSS